MVLSENVFPPCVSICCSPLEALALTPADTDQVARSQWLSTEPLKQEAGKKPDTPTSMLNVAGKKQKSFVLTVSGNISSSSGTVNPPSPSVSVSRHAQVVVYMNI